MKLISNWQYIGNLTDNKFVSLSSTSATIPLILMSANDCKDDAGTSGYTYVDCDVKVSVLIHSQFPAFVLY